MDLQGGTALAANILVILGAVFAAYKYLQNRLTRLERELRRTIETTLGAEAASTLQPVIVKVVDQRHASMYGDMARMRDDLKALGLLTTDLGSLGQAVRDVKERCEQLHAISARALETSQQCNTYITYMKAETHLGKIRIESQGQRWLAKMAAVSHTHGADEWEVLLAELIDICESIIWNTAINSRKYAFGSMTYREFVEEFGRRTNQTSNSWDKLELAFHEMIAMKCLHDLKERGPHIRSGENFYSKIIAICATAAATAYAELEVAEA